MPATGRFVLILALLMTMACQAATLLQQAGPIEEPHIPLETASRALTVSPKQTPTSLAIPTSTISPTATITPTATPTVPASPRQLSIFEELWQIVAEEYLYQDFNGLDWNAIFAEYRARIEAGMYDEHFYLAMDEMISRLGDDHSVFLSPAEVAEEEAQFAGNNDYVGVGFLLAAIPERSRAVILIAFPGSPADQAGLQPRDNLLAVNGEPVLDDDGFLRDLVRGPEGSTVTLTIQTPGNQPREVTLTRSRITGAVPVSYNLFITPSGLRIGYLLLVTFADNTIDGQIGDALRALAAEGPLDGIIVDNRFNEGGIFPVFRNALSYFTGGTLGYLVSREQERQLQVQARDVDGSQSIPLVVLIGRDTASYGEVFSGVLKDNGRAYLIGEATEGNVETLWGYDFEDGSRAWIAHESFRPFHNPDEDWELTGIIPHQWIQSDWDQVGLEDDPAVLAAFEYFSSR